MKVFILIFCFLILSSNVCFADALVFRFEGLSKPESKICLDIFEQSEKEHFLKPEKLTKRVVTPVCFEVSESQPTYRLKDLKPGVYSAAFFEDLIGDEKIQIKSFLGIPIPESPIGFSQNPTILFGPPSFDSCAIQVDGESKELVIKMKKLF